jgi:hypothetical protein
MLTGDLMGRQTGLRAIGSGFGAFPACLPADDPRFGQAQRNLALSNRRKEIGQQLPQDQRS